MKNSHSVLREKCFLRSAKAISLGTTLIAFLSSTFPAFATDFTPVKEAKIIGNPGAWRPGIANSIGVGSIILIGSSNDRCFADKVYGRGALAHNKPDTSYPGAMTVAAQYEKFLREKKSLDSHSSIEIERAVSNNDSAPPMAFGAYSFAIGCGAHAGGDNATAFGMNATTGSAGAQAFGVSALARGKASIAFGMGSEAEGESSVALSSLSSALADYSLSLGYRSKATAKDGLALGSYSVADTVSGGFGYDPLTNGAIKDITTPTWKSTLGAVSVGDNQNGKTRQIKSVAAGSDDTDAVNVAQLKKLREYATSGWKVTINGDTTSPVVFDKDSSLNFSVSNKNLNITKGDGNANVAFGLSDDITLKSVKTGGNSLTESGLDVGNVHITSTGINSGDKKITEVLNGDVYGSSKDAINGSQLYSMSNTLASYFGGGAKYDDGKWTAPTFKVSTIAADGTHKEESYNNVASAFSGVGSSFTNLDKKISDKINKLSDDIKNVTGNGMIDHDTSTNVISIGGTTGGSIISVSNDKDESRVVSGVKDGAVSSGSTDAINGSQLYSMSNTLASYFGGGAKYDDGKWTAPTFKVSTISADGTHKEESYNNVASAFSGVGSSFTNLDKKISDKADELSKEIKNVASTSTIHHDATTGSISIGGTTGGSIISVSNDKDESRVVSGVKDGAVSSGSTDAINGSQLYSMSNTLASYFGGGAKYDDGKWTAPTFKVSTISADGTHKEESYNNVASAFSGVGSSFTNLDKKISDKINKLSDDIKNVTGNGMIDHDTSTNVISIGGTTGGSIISVSNDKDESRVVSGVKDGAVSSGSTDAINGSQLYSMSNTLASYFGGGAKYDDGKWTAPTFKVSTISADGTHKEESYNNVASAFSGVGSSFTNLDKKISDKADELSKEIKNVASTSTIHHDATTGSISIGGTTGGSIISVSNDKDESRVVSGVKDGAVSSGSTDAINGSQLYSMSNTLASYFGGGAKYDDGKWTAPTFKVSTISADGTHKEESYNNVASAFSGVGSSFTNLDKKISDKINKLSDDIKNVTGNGMIDHDTSTNVISIGGTTGGSIISVSNDKDESRVVSGVKDGAVSSGSTDAINGSQLYSMSNTLASYFGGGAKYDDGKWTAPTFKVSTISADGTHKEESYNNVASAFSGVGSSFTNLDKKISDKADELSKEIKNVASTSTIHHDATTGSISIGGTTGGSIISVSNDKDESRVVSGVKDGAVSSGSTDAINGSQLYSMSNTLASYFGGGAKYDDGKWTAPTFKVSTIAADGTHKEESYNNVASAFSGVGSSFTNLDKKISDKINKLSDDIKNVTGNGMIDHDTSTNVISIGGTTGGSIISVSNDKDESRVVSGVKDGAVSSGSTDAINGSQLYSMSNTLASYFGGGAKYDDGKWTAPTFKVSTISADGTHKEESYNNVASAFSGVGSSFTNLDKKISDKADELSKEIKNVASTSTIHHDATTGSISIGGTTGGSIISVSNDKDESRVVSGVKDGAVSSGSTDAINGSQLYSMSNTLASYFGGGAKYDDGKWTAPTFKVSTISADGTHKEESYNNVASAFSGVGSSFTNLDKKISDKINKLSDDIKNVTGNGMIDHDTSTNVISIGGTTGGSIISVSNDKDESRVVSGVKDGAVSSGSTDAINGSQLYSMSNTLASYFGGGAKYDDGKWTAPTFKVSTISADGTHKEESYNNVASAFSGVGSSFTNLDKKISDKADELSKEIKNVASTSTIHHDATTGSISIGGTTGGSIISVSNDKDESRVVSGVKDGAVSSGSTDAINGSQLYSMSNTLASYFGGGAKYDDGKWTAPTFKVSTISADGTHKEESYNNVASAFSGVGSSFTNLDKKISDKADELSKEIKNVASTSTIHHDATTGSISIGGTTGGSIISVSNDKDESRVVSGVKDGAVSSGSTDAINGSQLYSMSNTLASYFGGGAKYDDGKWTAPTFKVSTISADGTHKEESYNNVASAFSGVGSSFTNLDKKISDKADELSKEIKNVASTSTIHHDATTGSISIGGTTGGSIISVSNDKDESRVVSGVKDGAVSSGSTDAINGSQLYSMSNTLASYFGGGAKYDDGKWTAPTFKVSTISADGTHKEESYNNVASAFSGVGSSFTNLDKKISDKINKLSDDIKNVTGNGMIDHDTSTNVISIGGTTGGSIISVSNDKDESRVVSGVKDGAVSSGSTDAINGSQLYSMSNTLASYFGGGAKYDDGKWTAPTFKVSTISADGTHKEESYNNVASAFSGVGSSFTNLDKKISDKADELSKEIKNVASTSTIHHDATTGSISIGGTTGGSIISVSNDKDESRVVSGVKDGAVSSGSTDAINGSQLYSMSNTLASYFGGGAKYDDGKWTAPTFKFEIVGADGTHKEESYQNVFAAFNGFSESMLSLSDRVQVIEKGIDPNILENAQELINGGHKIEEIENKVDVLSNTVTDIGHKLSGIETQVNVVTDGVIAYDRGEDGGKSNTITLAGGNESEPVLIDNLADGRVEEGSKEAVNGGQLYSYTKEQIDVVFKDAQKYTDESINNAVNDAKIYTDMQFESLKYGIDDVRKEARQAAAIGLAVSNLRYYDVPGSLSFSFGSGLWSGQSAFAIGAGYTSEDGNVLSSLSVTSAGGHWGIGGGITLRIK
ncbi:YadA-like family protein [Bartonella sp. B41]